MMASSAADEGQGPDVARSISEQNARSEQGRAELRARAATEDIERLRALVADTESKIAATPAVAERLDALDRQYAHLYASYQDFSARLQQASVQAQLERRQLGERFRILESAFPAPEPSSPNRFLLLALGTFMGLAIGFGIGLLAEMVDSSVHTAGDLQGTLGLPVLVSVPQIMLESDRVARTRRILRESVAALGVVFFCLIGGALTYFFVNGSPGFLSGGESDTEIEGEAPAGEEEQENFDFGIGGR
jgi:hypothetical protein